MKRNENHPWRTLGLRNIPNQQSQLEIDENRATIDSTLDQLPALKHYYHEMEQST
jgi:hypothetical protein